MNPITKTDSFIYCEKYKINVNPKAECMCETCIFWKIIYIGLLGFKKYRCTYLNWHPGLTKGKNE
jgi:hypothetical protein